MKFINRQHELAYKVADYLSDWLEDDSELMSVEENLRCIESYGISVGEPCDELVENALRHFRDIVNPWNHGSAIDTLIECCGFTEDECKKYYWASA